MEYKDYIKYLPITIDNKIQKVTAFKLLIIKLKNWVINPQYWLKIKLTIKHLSDKTVLRTADHRTPKIDPTVPRMYLPHGYHQITQNIGDQQFAEPVRRYPARLNPLCSWTLADITGIQLRRAPRTDSLPSPLKWNSNVKRSYYQTTNKVAQTQHCKNHPKSTAT